MSEMLTTKEVAEFLRINEKRVYSLVEQSGLPATKATGKWLFPKDLVRTWLENRTLNDPRRSMALGQDSPLFVVAGSNDLLLERCLDLFMRTFPEYTAVFGNLGSLGGIRALHRGLCHVAASHLIQDDERDYNFNHASRELDEPPAVVNFSRREQGLLLPPGNPRGIHSVADIRGQDLRLATRQPGTGTRLWFEHDLQAAGLSPEKAQADSPVMQRHLDVGLEVLAGRVDLGPGIRAVASLLELDFLPLHWERFDLLIDKETFFQKSIQAFLGIMQQEEFRAEAERLSGYDVSASGRMVYPGQE